MIAARLMYPLWPDKKLKTISRIYGYSYKNLAMIENPTTLLEYCGKDTVAANEILIELTNEIESHNLTPIFNMYCQFQLAFFALEIAGMKLDIPFLEKEEKKYNKALVKLLPLVPDPRMATNDTVLREWLQSHYAHKDLDKLPKSRKSQKSQISSQHLALLPKSSEAVQQTLDNIGKLRTLSKYKTLYIDRPLKFASSNEAGFLFPSYKLLVPRTHRRSTEPAIQNWPGESRQAIISRFVDGCIISADFKNLEARLFAWQAGCQKLLQDLIEGGYVKVASSCLGITIKDKKDPRYRQVKSTVLAVTYNMSPGLFAWREYVESGGKKRITKKEAEQAYELFFNTYPEIYSDIHTRKEYGWKEGAAYSSVDAPIPLAIITPSLLPDDAKWTAVYRKKVENAAVNFPTQQLASYVTGCALLDLQEILVAECGGWGNYLQELTHTIQFGHSYQGKGKLNGFPIIECHDELVNDVRGSFSQPYSELLRTTMTQGKSLLKLCPTLDTSILDVEIDVHSHWRKS